MIVPTFLFKCILWTSCIRKFKSFIITNPVFQSFFYVFIGTTYILYNKSIFIFFLGAKCIITW